MQVSDITGHADQETVSLNKHQYQFMVENSSRTPSTGELGYDRPLYNRFLHMTDVMLGPSPMHIKYSSYVYNRFCI